MLRANQIRSVVVALGIPEKPACRPSQGIARIQADRLAVIVYRLLDIRSGIPTMTAIMAQPSILRVKLNRLVQILDGPA